MSLAFDFHPEAEVEFDADVFWYEDREPGLGRRFRNQVGAAVDAAVDDPEAWAKASKTSHTAPSTSSTATC